MLKLGLCGWLDSEDVASPPEELDKANSELDRTAAVDSKTMRLVERLIAVVRRRRSPKAIETYEQVKFLVDFVGYLREQAEPTRRSLTVDWFADWDVQVDGADGPGGLPACLTACEGLYNSSPRKATSSRGAIPRQCWRDPGTAELDATDGKRAQRQHVPAPGAPETSAELRLMDPTSAPCSERRFTEKVWLAIAILRTHVIRGYRKLRRVVLPRCRVVLAK
ncbi:hypothetical protein ACG7TL_004496 [Trametes sanguinea]